MARAWRSLALAPPEREHMIDLVALAAPRLVCACNAAGFRSATPKGCKSKPSLAGKSAVRLRRARLVHGEQRLAHQVGAAANGHSAAGDIRSCRRQQEGHHACNFLRRSEPLRGDGRKQRGQQVLGSVAIVREGTFRIDDSRRNGIHPNSRRGPFDAQRLHEVVDARPRGCRMRHAGHAVVDVERHRNNGAAPSVRHARVEHSPRHTERGHKVQLHNRVEALH
mmetsp:Transcript_17345/g.65641  ORF Transcript_17345/g.65641 Transcript_17345/m.65641 type:complete len:223 (-) Transcript_17345:474-1142(-)